MSPLPLGVLRLAVAAIGLVQVLILWPSLLQLYGNFGFVQWSILELASDEGIPSIGKLSVVLADYGIESASVVRAVFALYTLALVGLAVGWYARAAAVIAWALHALTVNSGYVSLYGVDTMLHIALFYLIWMPVGTAISIDAYRARREATPTTAAGLSLRVLQVHLCLIYLNTGLAKTGGDQWWSGEALWRALMQPQFSTFDYSWLSGVPWLPRLAGWSVIVVELGYPLLIWPRRTRRLWLGAVVLLHLGIALFMGLWLFSSIMLVLNICAFGGLESKRERQLSAEPTTTLPGSRAGARGSPLRAGADGG